MMRQKRKICTDKFRVPPFILAETVVSSQVFRNMRGGKPPKEDP